MTRPNKNVISRLGGGLRRLVEVERQLVEIWEVCQVAR